MKPDHKGGNKWIGGVINVPENTMCEIIFPYMYARVFICISLTSFSVGIQWRVVSPLRDQTAIKPVFQRPTQITTKTVPQNRCPLIVDHSVSNRNAVSRFRTWVSPVKANACQAFSITDFNEYVDEKQISCIVACHMISLI